MLNFIMAPIMTAYLAVQYEVKARSIGNRQAELIKEWGGEVKGQATMRTTDASQQAGVVAAFDEEEKEAAAFDEKAENG
jgi:hypothetical protein